MTKMYSSNKGFFISFEGIDGCGKSTQVKLLEDKLNSEGKNVKLVREPGGLNISEQIRTILLNSENTSMTFETEALLMIASRAQLTDEVIRPLLKKDFYVIADRYADSTLAYQGGGRKLDIQILKQINKFATKVVPDMTFFIDLLPQEALKEGYNSPDRIEGGGIQLQKDVRKTYLELAGEFSNRFVVIDGNNSISGIHSIVWDKLINYGNEEL